MCVTKASLCLYQFGETEATGKPSAAYYLEVLVHKTYTFNTDVNASLAWN